MHLNKTITNLPEVKPHWPSRAHLISKNIESTYLSQIACKESIKRACRSDFRPIHGVNYTTYLNKKSTFDGLSLDFDSGYSDHQKRT